MVKVALNFLGDFRRKLRVNRLELKLILAGGDPCDLAVNYGRAWTAVGNLMPQLERLFVIKNGMWRSSATLPRPKHWSLRGWI